MDNRTETLGDGVWRVECAFFVNAYVLANNGRDDGDGLTLVDAGTPAGAARLVRSVRMLRFEPRVVDQVLLTHWHRDHAGGARRFAASSAAPTVHAHGDDVDVVRSGARPSPPAAAVRMRRIAHRLLPVPDAVPDVHSLHESELLPAAGGVRVVATPGHTRGHCSFLLPERGVLLAGDAVWNVLRLRRSPRLLSASDDAAVASVRRLAELDFEVLAPGHGPPVTTRARERITQLADRLGARAA